MHLRTHCAIILGETRGKCMSTNSRTFRTKLSEYFDLAIKKPISIARGSDRFILMNESEYLDLKDEVLSLQRNLISLLEVRSGKSDSIRNPQEFFSKTFNDVLDNVKKNPKAKKAAG